MARVDAGDLIVRTDNSQDQIDRANTFADLDALDDVLKFRPDADLWFEQTEERRVQAAVAAYKDICKLTWSTTTGRGQSTEYGPFEYAGLNPPSRPPVEDRDFRRIVSEAQACQIAFILAGTQMRDLAREGTTETGALLGSQTVVAGYRGPVCAEAMELLARYIERFPRNRRMA